MPTGGWGLIIFTWNPLTPLILTARDWLTGFPTDVLGPFLLVNAIVLVLLLFMGIVFRLAMPMLIERMGS
jgi:lipopolysaccharide transport system permease protein